MNFVISKNHRTDISLHFRDNHTVIFKFKKLDTYVSYKDLFYTTGKFDLYVINSRGDDRYAVFEGCEILESFEGDNGELDHFYKVPLGFLFKFKVNKNIDNKDFLLCIMKDIRRDKLNKING